MRLYQIVIVATVLLGQHQSSADQKQIVSFDEARRLLWEVVYRDGGETLYCGIRFRSKTDLGSHNSVEHVVPRDELETLCSPRARSCPRYALARADLHNLWPAFDDANSNRSNYPFDEIPGEEHRILKSQCADFERANSGSGYRVEPRDEMKGEITRSILYMKREYGGQFSGDDAMLLRWHRADPPSDFERKRNDIVEQLQGTRNPYIDGMGLIPR